MKGIPCRVICILDMQEKQPCQLCAVPADDHGVLRLHGRCQRMAVHSFMRVSWCLLSGHALVLCMCPDWANSLQSKDQS